MLTWSLLEAWGDVLWSLEGVFWSLEGAFWSLEGAFWSLEGVFRSLLCIKYVLGPILEGSGRKILARDPGGAGRDLARILGKLRSACALMDF